MKDEKTGDIEYVVFVSNESKRPQPIKVSQFKTKGDKLQLTLKKEEIQNALPMSSKDVSDLQDTKIRWDRCREARPFWSSAGVPGQRGLTQLAPWAKSLWVAADRAAPAGYLRKLRDWKVAIPAVSDK